MIFSPLLHLFFHNFFLLLLLYVCFFTLSLLHFENSFTTSFSINFWCVLNCIKCPSIRLRHEKFDLHFSWMTLILILSFLWPSFYDANRHRKVRLFSLSLTLTKRQTCFKINVKGDCSVTDLKTEWDIGKKRESKHAGRARARERIIQFLFLFFHFSNMYVKENKNFFSYIVIRFID